MVDWKITLIVFALAAWGLSHFMEHYKKVWRRDKAGTWEIRIVAFVLSALFVGVLMLLHLMLVPATVLPLVMGIVYVLLMYYVQMKVDMKIVKSLAVVGFDEKLKELGITEAQLEKLKEAVKS